MELTEEELSGGSPPVGGERTVSPLALHSSSSSFILSSVPTASATTPPPYTTIATSKTPPRRSYLDALLANAESHDCSPLSIISPLWETYDLLGLDLAVEVPVAAVREVIYLGSEALGEGPFVEKWEKEKLELLERLEALADVAELDEDTSGEGPMLDIFSSTEVLEEKAGAGDLVSGSGAESRHEDQAGTPLDLTRVSVGMDTSGEATAKEDGGFHGVESPGAELEIDDPEPSIGGSLQMLGGEGDEKHEEQELQRAKEEMKAGFIVLVIGLSARLLGRERLLATSEEITVGRGSTRSSLYSPTRVPGRVMWSGVQPVRTEVETSAGLFTDSMEPLLVMSPRRPGSTRQGREDSPTGGGATSSPALGWWKQPLTACHV